MCLGSTQNIVAEGKLVSTYCTEIHSVQLPPGNYRVRVEVAIQENASLPYPLTMEGYTLVGQAVGYDVGWPQHWVLTNQQTKEPFAPSTQQPRQSKKRIEALTQEPIEVPMTKILKSLLKFLD